MKTLLGCHFFRWSFVHNKSDLDKQLWKRFDFKGNQFCHARSSLCHSRYCSSSNIERDQKKNYFLKIEMWRKSYQTCVLMFYLKILCSKHMKMILTVFWQQQAVHRMAFTPHPHPPTPQKNATDFCTANKTNLKGRPKNCFTIFTIFNFLQSSIFHIFQHIELNQALTLSMLN